VLSRRVHGNGGGVRSVGCSSSWAIFSSPMINLGFFFVISACIQHFFCALYVGFRTTRIFLFIFHDFSKIYIVDSKICKSSLEPPR
jgi:hypothetical protein